MSFSFDIDLSQSPQNINNKNANTFIQEKLNPRSTFKAFKLTPPPPPQSLIDRGKILVDVRKNWFAFQHGVPCFMFCMWFRRSHTHPRPLLGQHHSENPWKVGWGEEMASVSKLQLKRTASLNTGYHKGAVWVLLCMC